MLRFSFNKPGLDDNNNNLHSYITFTALAVFLPYIYDKNNVVWAAEHKDSTIVYLYNPNNMWMIWDESEELMQYDRIYFVNLADDTLLEDEELLLADEIYVYTSRMDQAEILMEDLIKKNPQLENKEMIRELLYCDLYHLSSK